MHQQVGKPAAAPQMKGAPQAAQWLLGSV